MGQKVNPIAVRIGLNRKSDSSWFSDYYYATLFFQDYHIRNYLNCLKQPSGTQLGFRLAKCIVHHYPKKSCLHLFCLGSKGRFQNSDKQLDTPKYSYDNSISFVVQQEKDNGGSSDRLKAPLRAIATGKTGLPYGLNGQAAQRDSFLTPVQQDSKPIDDTAGLTGKKNLGVVYLKQLGLEQSFLPRQRADSPMLSHQSPIKASSLYPLPRVEQNCQHWEKLLVTRFARATTSFKGNISLFVGHFLSNKQKDAKTLEHFKEGVGFERSENERAKRAQVALFNPKARPETFVNPSSDRSLVQLLWAEHPRAAQSSHKTSPLSRRAFFDTQKGHWISLQQKASSLDDHKQSHTILLNNLTKQAFHCSSEIVERKGNVSAFIGLSPQKETNERSEFARFAGNLPFGEANSCSERILELRASNSLTSFVPLELLFCLSEWTNITCKQLIKSNSMLCGAQPHVAPQKEAFKTICKEGTPTLGRSSGVQDKNFPLMSARITSQKQIGLSSAFSEFLPLLASSSEFGNETFNYFVMHYFLKIKFNSKLSLGNKSALFALRENLGLYPHNYGTDRKQSDFLSLCGGLDNFSFQANAFKLCLVKSGHFYLSNLQTVLCNQTNTLTSIIPIQVTSIYQSASLVAQEICFQLEQTKSFRQICKTMFQEIEQLQYIKGIRIACSGRLNGAEIAKTECKKYGETSLHVFSDQIDYASMKASTPYGILGVKVWISYLPKLD